MRHIKYIIINDSMPEASRGKSSNIRIDNLGYHYVINSQGEMLNPIDVSNPANLTLDARLSCVPLVASDQRSSGRFAPQRTRNLKPETKHLKPRGIERLNACSVGVKYNGSIADDLKLYTLNSATDFKLSTLDSQRMALLLALLNELRSRYPDAAILALNEIRPGTRCLIRVRDDMNDLRRELSHFSS